MQQLNSTSFAKLTTDERRELINQVASGMNISPVMVEKDYWVSFLLNEIFALEISEHLTFKGGTSLSKCFGFLNRFSEDIDLTIDKEVLLHDKHIEGMSGKEFQKYIVKIQEKGREFVSTDFTKALEDSLNAQLESEQWTLEKDKAEPMNIRFIYPASQSIDASGYIKPSVLLEFGVRGEITPSSFQKVQSYVHKSFPSLLKERQSPIKTLSPIRTFWEKATILHAEYHRPAEKSIGDRLSRHYYDLYQMMQSGVHNDAMRNIDLLVDVVKHKQRFFRSSWASYDRARVDKIHLSPNRHLEALLRQDYKNMEGMLFGEIPTFDDILNSIRMLEADLHGSEN